MKSECVDFPGVFKMIRQPLPEGFYTDLDGVGVGQPPVSQESAQHTADH